MQTHKLPDFAIWPRVVVELGSGDGRNILALAENDKATLYLGIEIRDGACKYTQASQILRRISNVVLIHGSFQEVIPALPDVSIDELLVIMPHPTWISKLYESQWKPFYKVVYSKLKPGGKLELVTEFHNMSLNVPIKASQYESWMKWLTGSFESIGFVLKSRSDSPPGGYSSLWLDFYKKHPNIRLATFEFVKDKAK